MLVYYCILNHWRSGPQLAALSITLSIPLLWARFPSILLTADAALSTNVALELTFLATLLGVSVATHGTARAATILKEAAPRARITAEFAPIALSGALFGGGAWVVQEIALNHESMGGGPGAPVFIPQTSWILAIALTSCHLAAIATLLLRLRPHPSLTPWLLATTCWLAVATLARPDDLPLIPHLMAAFLDGTSFLGALGTASLTRIGTVVDTMPTVALLLAALLIVDSRVPHRRSSASDLKAPPHALRHPR